MEKSILPPITASLDIQVLREDGENWLSLTVDPSAGRFLSGSIQQELRRCSRRRPCYSSTQVASRAGSLALVGKDYRGSVLFRLDFDVSRARLHILELQTRTETCSRADRRARRQENSRSRAGRRRNDEGDDGPSLRFGGAEGCSKFTCVHRPSVLDDRLRSRFCARGGRSGMRMDKLTTYAEQPSPRSASCS